MFSKTFSYETSVGEDANILSYDDAFDIAGWARPAMQWACSAGVLDSGLTASIRPQGAASRAEVAKAVYSFCEDVAR